MVIQIAEVDDGPPAGELVQLRFSSHGSELTFLLRRGRLADTAMDVVSRWLVRDGKEAPE